MALTKYVLIVSFCFLISTSIVNPVNYLTDEQGHYLVDSGGRLVVE